MLTPALGTMLIVLCARGKKLLFFKEKIVEYHLLLVWNLNNLSYADGLMNCLQSSIKSVKLVNSCMCQSNGQ